MPEVTYESVRPLVVSAVRLGGRVHCVFRCPVTGTEVASSAELAAAPGPEPRDAGFWPWIRLGVLAALHRALGDDPPPDLSEPELRAGVVAAFRAAEWCFSWDGSRWVAKVDDVMREFTDRLRAAPLSEYDRRILGRVLRRIASAPEEESFLEQVAAFEKGRPVTRAELSATSPGHPREVILLLAWTLAFADEHVELAEVEELEKTALGLGLDFERSLEIKRLAQLYLVHLGMARACRSGKAETLEQVTRLAGNIGLDLAELTALESVYRGRQTSRQSAD